MNEWLTSKECEMFKDKIVVCENKNCDGEACRHYHDKPHKFVIEECGSVCLHPGKNNERCIIYGAN